MTQEDYEARDKLLVGTFETALGSKYLEFLVSHFVDRDMYEKGMTLEEVAYRQGQASLIRKIQQVMEGANRGK